jgi:hypothetical protein
LEGQSALHRGRCGRHGPPPGPIRSPRLIQAQLTTKLIQPEPLLLRQAPRQILQHEAGKLPFKGEPLYLLIKFTETRPLLRRLTQPSRYAMAADRSTSREESSGEVVPRTALSSISSASSFK